MKSQPIYQTPRIETPINPSDDSWNPSSELMDAQKQSESGDVRKDSERIEELLAQIENWQKQKVEWQDQLQRKQAELDNMRKRFEREKQEIASWAKAEVLLEILPVMDACDRAAAGLGSSEKGSFVPEAFRSGLDLIGRKLQDSLAKFNVAAIPALGETFNPHLHEALMREETDKYPDQQVIAEFQKGYQVNGKLLRPAQVKVSIHPTSVGP